MAGTISIHRLVCRGSVELDPQVWEVWGTSRDCPSVDVSFRYPASDVPPPTPGKTVTVIPGPRSERLWDIDCAEGETLWVARFYRQEHPQLWPLRAWLKADEGRGVEIEAKATALPAVPAVPGPALAAIAIAKATFRNADILQGYEFDAGVLLVHGIGAHRQGETLIRFTEPVLDFLQRWLRGASDQWSNAYSREEAAQWRDRVFHSTLRHQQNLFDLTDEADRFVRQSAKAFPKVDRASIGNLMSGEFLVGDVCAIDTVLRPLAADPEIAGTTLIRMSTLGQSGALSQTHLLVSEAWWTKDVAPPTSTQLRDWIVYALPQVVSTYFATPAKAMARQRAAAGDHPSLRIIVAQFLDGFTAVVWRGPLALLFCAITQVLLTIVATLSLVPIPWLRAILKPVIDVLMGTTGQSYAMVTSELRRSAIVSKVNRQLDWLCSRCEKVVVLAHSQGAEVSRHVIALRARPEVRRFISFGSGVKMLGVLTSEERPLRHVVCAACTLVLVPLTFFVVASGVSVWEALLGLYSTLVVVGIVFVDPPGYNPTFRASVPMTDYYASRDPVPCGPLSDEKDILDKVHFKLIEVYNRASALFDHTSYLENTEEFVAPVALDIAELAGFPVGNLMKDDARRREDAIARRQRLIFDKQLIGRLAAVALVVAALISFVVDPSTWSGAMKSAFTSWRDFGWSDWFPAIGRLPAVVYPALPVFIVVALFVIERMLLHGKLMRNAESLVKRREPAPDWTAVAVRIVAYGVGVGALIWWAQREHLGAAMAAMARRLLT